MIIMLTIAVIMLIILIGLLISMMVPSMYPLDEDLSAVGIKLRKLPTTSIDIFKYSKEVNLLYAETIDNTVDELSNNEIKNIEFELDTIDISKIALNLWSSNYNKLQEIWGSDNHQYIKLNLNNNKEYKSFIVYQIVNRHNTRRDFKQEQRYIKNIIFVKNNQVIYNTTEIKNHELFDKAIQDFFNIHKKITINEKIINL